MVKIPPMELLMIDRSLLKASWMLWLLTCVLLANFNSYADQKNGQPEFEKFLVGGKEDLSENFPSVISFSLVDNSLKERCSGTKVGPNILLTAAHCILDEVNQKDVTSIEKIKLGTQFYFSSSPKISSPKQVTSTEVVNVFVPPGLESCFDKPEKEVAHCVDKAPDIALIQIKESQPFNVIETALMDLSFVDPGDTVSVVGYGLQGENDIAPPVRKSHTMKVVAPEILKKVYEELSDAEDEVDNELYFGTYGISMGEEYASLGSGDSGGAVFKEREGVQYLVGVNAFAFCPNDTPDCEITSNSFFARIHSGGRYKLGEWLSDMLR
jgi:secreted trypsin-like serine protease